MTDKNEGTSVLSSTPVAASQTPEHYDDYAVRTFAKMMAEKMALSRAKGRSGWNDPEQCSVEYLRHLLYEHLAKGDPVDVANICMMLRHYEASTAPDPALSALMAEWMLQQVADKMATVASRYAAAKEWECATAVTATRTAILAIPGPTPTDLLAHALALPEIKRLVEAAEKARNTFEIYEDEEMVSQLAAALPKGSA